MYFILTNHDGEAVLVPLIKVDLLEKLNHNYYGDIEFKTLDWLQNNSVENLNGAILIKGEIVVPHAKKTVVEFDVP